MRNKFFYRTIVSIVAVFFAMYCVAQNKTTVKATIDRSQILIGEPIRLVLEADIPENEVIRFFQPDSIPHFELLNIQKIDTSNTGNGTVLSQAFQITSFDSGHWVIPSFILGDRIVTDTIPVDVGFAPFNPEQPYHDTKDIIEVNPTEEKQKIKWWYIVAGAALVMLLLILLFRKKKKPVVQAVVLPPDPFKVAMAELEILQKEKPEAKQYYSKLVDIFREYILAKKGIHSLQATTDDFVKQLKSLALPKQQFEDLSQSLRLSDFVKFAKYIPSADDDKNFFEIIYRTIQQIEQVK
ncbi:MAG: hypothetical protein ACXWV2_10630 [Chitinophagaceae bacterium]